jgi:hypothetical protein
MKEKFIYVQDEKDKEELIKSGYRLLQENKNSNLYVFENKETNTLNFDLKDSKYILTDTLMF